MKYSFIAAFAATIAVGMFSAGSASAGGRPDSYFLWTGPLPGLVLVLSANPQVFMNEPMGPPIVCMHFGGHSILSNGQAMTVKTLAVTGRFTKCELLGAAATVSTAELLFSADGTLSVVGKPIVITIPSLNLSLKFNNGAPNTNLRLLLFLNGQNDLLIHSEVSRLTSLASDAGGEEKTEGEFRGLLLALVHGGRLQWVR